MPLQWFSGFESYSYRARLLPVLLTVLPVLLTVMILCPALYTGKGAAIPSALVSCGAMWFLANVVLPRGRAAEAAFVKQWSGHSTARTLRHRNDDVEPNTKRRHHALLMTRVSSLRLPKVDRERTDPNSADAAYRSDVNWPLEFRQNAYRLPLVRIENTAYGFWRYLYRAEPLGLALYLVSTSHAATAVVGADAASHRAIRALALFWWSC
ncbi:MAG: hypothetical protein JWL61_2340 [Gemmatimonadetes bacterium]|nr:hypothetical protein [Gemmatimonadota bacterium]